MRLTRRALFGLASALGLAGRVEADEDDTESVDGSCLYSAGLYGEGVHHNYAAVENDKID